MKHRSSWLASFVLLATLSGSPIAPAPESRTDLAASDAAFDIRNACALHGLAAPPRDRWLFQDCDVATSTETSLLTLWVDDGVRLVLWEGPELP